MKLKRIVALIATVAMMATMLFGCGKPADNKTTAAPDNKTTEAPNADPTDGPTEAPTEAPPVYPLEGDHTITEWVFASTQVEKFVTQYGYDQGGFQKMMENRPYAAKLKELTGINVQYVSPTSRENNATEYQIMITEGNYTDILGFKGTEVEFYAEDGVIIAIDDIIEQYMPNYKAYLEANPEVEKVIRAADGKIYGVPMIMEDQTMGTTSGVFCRQDWLDELKIATPTTIDEWYDALVKIRDAKKDVFTEGKAPIIATITNLLQKGAFLNAYVPDRQGGDWCIEDGKVTFIPAMDGMREYLKTLKKWFAEGLIDQNAFGSIGSSLIRGSIANGQAFMSIGFAGSSLQRITTEAIAAGVTDIELTAVGNVAAKKGEAVKYYSGTPAIATTTSQKCISTKCKDVEAAARYLDFFFTEDGYMLSNFGIEGTTYNIVNGVPTYTDFILKNPEGLAINEAMAGYMTNFEGGYGIQAKAYLDGYYSTLKCTKEAIAKWTAGGELDVTARNLKFTLEETEDMKLYSELTKFVKEALLEFVKGDRDIDTGWDAFIKELDAYGYQEMKAIYEAAYQRYLAQ